MSILLIVLAFLWGVATASWYWSGKMLEREMKYYNSLDDRHRKLVNVLIGDSE